MLNIGKRRVASRCAQSSSIRPFQEPGVSSGTRITQPFRPWDPRFGAPPFLPLFSPAAPRFPSLSRPSSSLSPSLSFFLESFSASRSAKMHVRMLATLLLSLQYSIVSYVIYDRRRGKGRNAKMIHVFLYRTRINL